MLELELPALVFAMLGLVLLWPDHSTLCPHRVRMFALCLSTLGNTLVSQHLILKGLPRVSPEEILAFSTVLGLLTTVGTF